VTAKTQSKTQSRFLEGCQKKKQHTYAAFRVKFRKSCHDNLMLEMDAREHLSEDMMTQMQ